MLNILNYTKLVSECSSQLVKRGNPKSYNLENTNLQVLARPFLGTVNKH